MLKRPTNYLLFIIPTLLLSSCCTPAYNTLSSPTSCGVPVAVSETHSKTTQPASFSMPYVPPASIYQAPPMAVAQPVQAPVCLPQTYQTPMPMQANPCLPYQAPIQSNHCYPQYQAHQIQPVNSQSCYQVSNSDPCNPQYMLHVPQPRTPVYQISLPPPTPATYQIQVPQQLPPQYQIQQAQPLKSDICEPHPVQNSAPC